jgi:nicotinamidase-related amidase
MRSHNSRLRSPSVDALPPKDQDWPDGYRPVRTLLMHQPMHPYRPDLDGESQKPSTGLNAKDRPAGWLTLCTVIITGARTNMSIEHTARHAADLGFKVIVASDGTSTINDEWQNVGLNYALTNVGVTPTCAEIMSALQT